MIYMRHIKQNFSLKVWVRSPRGGAETNIQLFSEYSHVAYQIKGNHARIYHGSKYFARRHTLAYFGSHLVTIATVKPN